MKPIVAATPDQVRDSLQSLASAHRVSLSALSRMVGRPQGYLARFARGAGPERLRSNEILLLGKFFRVDPRVLGDREEWEPS